MNNLILKFDANMRVDKSLIQNMFQYSTMKLIVFLTEESADLGFSWITPGGVQLEERSLIRDIEEDDDDLYAYSATIYPSFTLNFPTGKDTAYTYVSVRNGLILSPLIRVPVDKTISPSQDELTPTNYTELAARTLDIENFVAVDKLGQWTYPKLALSTIVPATSLSIGETRWDSTSGLLETRVSNDVYLQHGSELIVRCQNKEGTTLANGTPVYISGASGSSSNFYIKKANNNAYETTSTCIGLTTELITDNAFGYVCLKGIVNNLNTFAFEVGDVVYLGAGGIITNVRPTTNILALGIVIQKSSTLGRIALSPIFFPRLEDLSTINFNSLANGDVIIRTTNGWTNYNLDLKANVQELEDGSIIVKNATRAEQDADGNIITSTYLTTDHENSALAHPELFSNFYPKTETYTRTEIDNKVSSLYRVKGSVATYADLADKEPTAISGDVWNVLADELSGGVDVNYVFTESGWDIIGGIIPLASAANDGLLSMEDYASLQNMISGGVTSVNGETGDVILDASDVGALPDTHDASAVTSIKISNWDAAYNWGDHSLAGYLSAETDPVFAASTAASIIAQDITNWNAAHSWGDHSLEGYLSAETDPVFAASTAASIIAQDITNWNAAHSWGDHSLAGYLTSASNLDASKLTGTINKTNLPGIAITSTFVVASEVAQLALTAEEGDVAIRSDISKTYIKNDGITGTMTDWSELLSPTDTVLSVNSKTGAVVLNAADVGALSSTHDASAVTSAKISNWDAAYSATNAATNANTVSTIVKRDSSGNFSAGTITADLTGTASGNLTSASTLDASKLSGTIPSTVNHTGYINSIKINGTALTETSYAVDITSIPYTTTAPTSNWTGAGIKVAVLSTDPTTKYTGWIYFITE